MVVVVATSMMLPIVRFADVEFACHRNYLIVICSECRYVQCHYLCLMFSVYLSLLFESKRKNEERISEKFFTQSLLFFDVNCKIKNKISRHWRIWTSSYRINEKNSTNLMTSKKWTMDINVNAQYMTFNDGTVFLCPHSRNHHHDYDMRRKSFFPWLRAALIQFSYCRRKLLDVALINFHNFLLNYSPLNVHFISN